MTAAITATWFLKDLPDTPYSPAVRAMVYLAGAAALFGLFSFVGILHTLFYMRRLYQKMMVLHDLQAETLEITRHQQERAVSAAARVARVLPAVSERLDKNTETLREEVRAVPAEAATQVVERMAGGPPSGIAYPPTSSPPS